jgi:hypothetical protein
LIRDDRIRHLLCLVIGLTISDHAASVKYGRPVPYTPEERPFDAGVTAGMGRMVREIDGMRAGEEG